MYKINSSHAADLIDSSDLYRKGARDLLPKSIVDSIDDTGFEKTYEKLKNINFDREGRYFDNPESSRKQIQKIIDDIRNGDPIDPIIIDRKGNAMDGQHRMSAFDFLGVEEIPVYKGYFGGETVFDNQTTRMRELGIPQPEPFFKEELHKVDKKTLYVVYQAEDTNAKDNFYFHRSELNPTDNGVAIKAVTILKKDVFETNIFPGSDEEFNGASAVAKDLSKKAVKISEGHHGIVIKVLDENTLNPHLSILDGKPDIESVFEIMRMFDKDLVDGFREDLGRAVLTKYPEMFETSFGNGVYELKPFDEDGNRGVDMKIAGGVFQLDKFEAMEVNRGLHIHFQKEELILDRGLDI